MNRGGLLRRNYFTCDSVAAQLILHGCDAACAASILAILIAIAIQIPLKSIVFQSIVIKVSKKH